MGNPGVFAVVVTFNPQPSLRENVDQLARQASHILIIDNGSTGEAAQTLQALAPRPGLTLVRNQKNLGIAAALNSGIRRGIENGFEWIATFDQDSTITADFFSGQQAAYEQCPFKSRVGIIAPVLCTSEAQAEERRGKSLAGFTLTRTAMTSGSLLRADVFAKEGPYDEDFFMDYVDYDYCLRLYRRGWKIIRANESFLVHRLGLAERHSFFGLSVTTKTHSPWRRYHIMRNRFVIYRRYALSSPLWCLYDFVWIFLELTKIILFEKEKGLKFRNMARGLLDGLAGKMGQFNEPRNAPTTS